MKGRWARLAAAASGAAILAAGTAAIASAHDFWLVPNAFRLEVGQQLTVFGRTSSSFPGSISAVAVDRVADARVLSADTVRFVAGLDIDGRSLRIRHSPEHAGQHVIAVRIHPRHVPESAESFRRYLDLEGAPEALARFERAGLMPTDSILRSYAKYAKTIVEVGSGGPRAFDLSAGHPLEFVPLADPDLLRVGDSLSIALLYGGRPLPNAPVRAGVAGSIGDPAPRFDTDLLTDVSGAVTLAVHEAGIWNVRSLLVVPATEPAKADWEAHWATLVFRVMPRHRS